MLTLKLQKGLIRVRDDYYTQVHVFFFDIIYLQLFVEITDNLQYFFPFLRNFLNNNEVHQTWNTVCSLRVKYLSTNIRNEPCAQLLIKPPVNLPPKAPNYAAEKVKKGVENQREIVDSFLFPRLKHAPQANYVERIKFERETS